MGAKKKERWVIKLGTGILSDGRGRLDLAQFATLVKQISTLRRGGIETIVVTSGAVGSGMGILGLDKRPKAIEELQACAAIGQPQIMRLYEELFAQEKLHVAQILLTYFDLDSRSLYANAKKTISHLLGLNSFIPIINENDVVSYEEIKFGDNDRLSAEVAIMAESTRLIILSNVPGLLRKMDGKNNADNIVSDVPVLNEEIEALAGKTRSETSVGGMITKLTAAKLVTAAGIPMQIANGREADVLIHIKEGKRKVGTLFHASKN